MSTNTRDNMETLAVQLLAKHAQENSAVYSDRELSELGRIMTGIVGSPSRKAEILNNMNKGA